VSDPALVARIADEAGLVGVTQAIALGGVVSTVFALTH